jgi:hypothetical protein
MGINKMVGANANMHLKVNLNAKDAQAALASLAKKLENLEKISAIDLDVKNIKGIGDLLVQLQTLDKSMTALLENSKIAGQSLRDEMVGSINSVIDAFQHGNELSNVFLNELNEIANITDKSQMPEKIRALVERMNQEFKGLGVAIKINADDILNLGSTKEQLNSLAGYVTKFTSTWSNGMTFAAQQTNGLVKSVSDVEAEINKLLTKLNELRTVEKSVAGIINTISSGGEFKRLSKEENETIDEFAEKALNRYNEAEQRFIANQSNLEARQKAAIDMANAAKDVIRAMSYDFTDEDGGVWEIADVVDEDVSSGLEEVKNRFLSRAKEIKSLFKTEIADIEQQLSAAGIDIKTPVHVTPQKDPKAGKKIKQAVEESAPKEVEVPVKTNLNTDNTKEIVSLVEQLQKVFDIGRKKNTLEYKVLFTADGLDIRNGSFEGINSKTYAESLLSNLMSGVNVNAHSHMGKYSELTLPDIKSAIDAKKNLGINISAVIGPDDIATLDLAQVKLEDLYTLLEKLSKLPYADSLGIQAKDLNNALKEINPNYGDIFKQWKPEKFEELAKYIYNVSQATQSTIDPLEQFKSIVSFIASKDIDFSKHQGVLDSLSANNFSPDALKSAFNEIAQAEKIMSDGKILKIDVPEKSSIDAVTKSLQDQIDAYRTKRKEAGLTFDKLRKEVLMLEANHYDTKVSFIERYFHPSELDDVIKTLKSGGSVKAITEKLASEFNIEIPVKPKVETKPVEDNYQKVLDLLNQIAVKQKEIREVPEATKSVDMVNGFVKDYGTLDEYKKKIKEVFNEYYQLQKELSAIPSNEKSRHESSFKLLEEYKSEIAGLVISAQNEKIDLATIFGGTQLKTINSSKVGIQDLITQWREYDNTIGEIYKSNIPVEQSVDSLRESILELAKASNVSKDAWNTIVYMLYEIGDSTDLNKFATTINGLISGTITPELTILKQQLTNMFKDTDVEQLELKYLGVFDKVKEGSLTAAQALEQIEKQEQEIAEAARKREEAQRKANDAGSQPTKPSGTGSGTGTGTGTSTGTGSTTPPSGTGTGSSIGTEIADLEKLKKKVSEVELEVVKKTRAFNDEKAAVGKVVEAEMSELTKLSTKIKQVIGEVNNYSTAWTNADSNVTTVVEKEGKLIESLLQKLQNLSNILANEISKANLNINTGNTSPVDSGSTPLQGVSVSVDPKLSSTLEILNNTLSQMIGSGDDSSQKTSPNQGLSGIATNVANIYGILNNPASKDSGQEQNNSDNRLPNVLTDLNNTLSRFAGISDTSSKATDTSSSIGGIATNVANIYDTIKGRKDNDDALATSIKGAVNELHEASKYIADDAKLRQESNTKYQAASDRISTDAGRNVIMDSIQRKYGNEYLIPDNVTTKFSSLAGGIVQVDTVLQGLDKKFYDLSITIDSQGNIIEKSRIENGKAAEQAAKQEAALNKAREDAARKAQQAAEAEIKSKQTAQGKVINSAVDATKQKYDSFFSTNTINNAAIKGVQTEYQDLLQLLAVKEEIYKTGQILSNEEVADIEDRCKKIQEEISALIQKRDVVAKQKSLIETYGTNTSSIKEDLSKGIFANSSHENDILNTLKEIDIEAAKIQQKTKDGRMQLLSKEELDQVSKKLDELYAKLNNIVEKAQSNAPKGAFTKTFDKQFTKIAHDLAQFKLNTKDINLSSDIQSKVDQLEATFKQLQDMRTVFEGAKKGSLTAEQTVQWEELVNQAKGYQKELNTIFTIYQKLSSGKAVKLSDVAENVNKEDPIQMHDAMKKYLDILYGSKGNISNIRNEQGKLTATFTDAQGRINQVTIAYREMDDALTHTVKPIGQVDSLWTKVTNSIGKKATEMVSYFATFGSIYRIIGFIKQGINSIKEIDSALTELKKVTSATSVEYDKFLTSMSKTAGVVGSTVKDLTTMAAEWARLNI